MKIIFASYQTVGIANFSLALGLTLGVKSS